MAELKPCPFCGETWRITSERFIPDAELPYVVVCASCGIMGPKRLTRAEAIEAWNRRTPSRDREAEIEVTIHKDESVTGVVLVSGSVTPGIYHAILKGAEE